MEKEGHKKVVFEYSKITEQIYLGTNKCCQYHFKKSLLKKGINADISLEKKRIDHPIGVDYYLWLPTRDHYPPTIKQMIVGAQFIKNLVENKIKVFVHCERGHTRAPTLVAAYFILEGMGIDKAIAKIKKKRPVVHISPVQKRALHRFKKWHLRK
jgi:protein-tyrosine phosphatase